MASLTVEKNEGTWLDRHAPQWVEAGLLSDEQVDSIRHFEHLDEPAAPRLLTTVAEVSCYLGSVIAFAGGAAIIGPNWEALGLIGQLALAFAIAAVGFGVGFWLIHLADAGTQRLGSFLWVVGTGGVAMAVAVVMQELDPRNDAWFGVSIGAAILTLGAALWRNLDRPLQLATAAVGTIVTGAGLMELTDLSVWVAAPALWLSAAGFGVLALASKVQPRLVGLMVAAVGIMIGSFLFAEQSERLSAIVATASASLIVIVALRNQSLQLLGIGMIAFLIATLSLMQTVLHSMGARLVAVVVGLGVVTLVAIRAQRIGRTTQDDTDS